MQSIPQRLNSDKFMKTGSTELFPLADPIKPDVTSQAHEEKLVRSVRGGANRCDGYEMRHRFA